MGGFVGVDLGVPKAGAVVYGCMHIPPADLLLRAGVACAVGPPAAAVGYPDEFLDVDVYQLTRQIALVPLRAGGGSVSLVEAADAGGGDDPTHSGGSQTQLVADPGRPPPVFFPHSDHLFGFAVRGTRRGPLGAGRTILKAGGAFSQEPVPPLADSLGIDLEPFSRSSGRPAFLQHRFDQF